MRTPIVGVIMYATNVAGSARPFVAAPTRAYGTGSVFVAWKLPGPYALVMAATSRAVLPATFVAYMITPTIGLLTIANLKPSTNCSATAWVHVRQCLRQTGDAFAFTSAR